MRNLINLEYQNWENIRNTWIQTEGESNTYLNLEVIPFDSLANGRFHNLNGYDLLLPPLQILGNLDDNIQNKLLIISLEPLKTDRDLEIQYRYFYNTLNENIFELYGQHILNLENYYNYQLNYFNAFPQIIGAPSPHTNGSNLYWRYIDCLANGYSNNSNITSQDWNILKNSIVDLPLIPLWARTHRVLNINNSIRTLFVTKLNILKPNKILVLGKTQRDLIMGLMELNENEHYINTFQNGNNTILLYQKNFEWGNCEIYFRRFFTNGGGSYDDAFHAGQIISGNHNL